MSHRKAKQVRREARGWEEPWEPFHAATVPPSYVLEPGETVWKNNLYTVYYNRRPAVNEDTGEAGIVLHLSIKRNDREVIHDWRHLQRIKNAIVGPEQEICELYPAESRLVDTANQYHMWGVEGVPMPFGFQERRVAEAGAGQAKQRPFPADAKPSDRADISQEEYDQGLRCRRQGPD